MHGGAATAADAQRQQLDAAAADVLALMNRDAEEGLRRGEEALAQARELGYVAGQAALERAIGANLNILGRNGEALDHYDRALALFREVGDPAAEVQTLRSMGVSLYDMDRVDEALARYLDALRIAESIDDALEQAKTLANIGNVYYALENWDEAATYQQWALAAFETAGYRPGIAGVALNLGALHIQQADRDAGPADADAHLEQARTALERSLAEFRALDIPRGIVSALGQLGALEDRAGNAERALERLTETLELRRAIGDRAAVLNNLKSVSGLHLRLEHFAEARRHLIEAETIARELDADDQLRDVLERRSEVELAAGDPDQAVAYLQQLWEIDRARISAETSARVEALQAAYEAEQAQREVELLRQQRLIDELRLERASTTRNALILGALLLLGLLAMTWSRYRVSQRAGARLAEMARTDPLTRLLNRRGLREIVDREIARARRNHQPLALLAIDLDRFKRVNDEYGHDAGDDVLVEVARRLSSTVRGADVVARWGGEEFLVLLPDTELDRARDVGEKLRAAVGGTPIVAGAHSVVVSLTIGIARIDPEQGLDACLQRADHALRRGKEAGRDRVVRAD